MTGNLKFCSSNCIEGVNQLFSWVGNLAGYFGATAVESNANGAAGSVIDGDASTCTTLASGAAANIDLKVFDEQARTKAVPIYKVRLYGVGFGNTTTVSLAASNTFANA
jgi:hypothetical protein